MIKPISDLKPEYCEECKEQTPHKRIFTNSGIGGFSVLSRGHHRLITATCTKCDTVIYYE